jgi:hypothetical protein
MKGIVRKLIFEVDYGWEYYKKSDKINEMRE